MAKYCVTITRTGWLFIEAKDEIEAMEIADHQLTSTVNWSDDWAPTSVEENDSAFDEEYISEKAFE